MERVSMWPLVLLAVSWAVIGAPTGAQAATPPPVGNQTKIQARISLQRNNLDIEDIKPVNEYNESATEKQNLPELLSTISSETNSTARQFKAKKLKEKSNRRLSNIWSMFLPGNSDSTSSDYDSSSDEDEAAAEIEQAKNSSLKLPIAGSGYNDTNKRLGAMSNLHPIESHADQSVDNKYSRPPRQDSLQMLPDSTTAGSVSSTTTESTSNKLDQSVQLITGSLISKDSFSPSMNDIVSSIMNSMSSNNDLNKPPSSSESGEVEREEENVDSNKKNNTSSNKETGNASFERWLNQIQFQDQSATASTDSQKPIGGQNKTLTNGNHDGIKGPTITRQTSHKWHQQGPQKIQPEKTVQKIGSPNEIYSKQQSKQNHQQSKLSSELSTGAVKGESKLIRATGSVSRPVHVASGSERLAHQVSYVPQQHPFQQQLRQQQAQLIHGIKYPHMAQASTISLSQPLQEDALASNTSFQNSFGFLSSLNNPSLNEMSQLISANTSEISINAGSSESNGNNIEQQSVYQSQDEILRQVTSAINFEQQQQNQINKKEDHNNHRKQGESAIPSELSTSDKSSAEQISKLFKVGSSLNELISSTDANTTQPTMSPESLLMKANMNSSNNQSASMLGMDDIDKSFDMLAEKLRQFAQQQQQAANGSSPNGDNQPSWLRKPNQQHEVMAKLAAALSGTNSSTSTTSSNMENLRELLSRYEKNKNELKSSQDNMAQLMQQLAQKNNPKPSSNHMIQQRQQQQLALTTSNPMASLLRGELSPGSGGQTVGGADGNVQFEADSQESDLKPPSGVSNIGWMPVKPANLNISPANLLKNKYPKYPMKVSQLGDNEATGNDFVDGEEFFMNNLAHMLANSADGATLEEADLGPAAGQKIIGLPIAILKEDEIERRPETPEQQLANNSPLVGPPTVERRLPGVIHPANQFAPRQATQSSPPAFNPNQLNQIQKILQNYSPQTFLQQQQQQKLLQQSVSLNRFQHQPNGPTVTTNANNNMASLIPNADHLHNHEQQVQNNVLLNQYQNLMSANNLPGEQGNLNTLASAHNHNQQTEMRQQELKTPVKNVQSEPFKMNKQAQQQQPQITTGVYNQHRQNIVEYPTRPDLLQPESIDRHRPPSPLPHFITTTVTNQGPPVRLRELSLYKPFGFRSHHSIAYQAPPTIAGTLFPALAHGHHRPGLLRQMTPFRAPFAEGQRLLGPLIPQPITEALNNRYHHTIMGNNNENQFQTLVNSLPLPPPLSATASSVIHHPQQFVRFGTHMRRHSPPNNLPSNNLWHSNHPEQFNKPNSQSTMVFDAQSNPSRRRAYQKDRQVVDYEQYNNHIANQENVAVDEMKYNLPMDSFIEPITISDQDGRAKKDMMIPKHMRTSNLQKEDRKKPTNYRQQRTQLEKQILEEIMSNKSIPCINSSSTTTSKPSGSSIVDHIEPLRDTGKLLSNSSTNDNSRVKSTTTMQPLSTTDSS